MSLVGTLLKDRQPETGLITCRIGPPLAPAKRPPGNSPAGTGDDASSQRYIAGDLVSFVIGILAVIGLAALGAWAITLLVGSLMQCELTATQYDFFLGLPR
jgi:hypothetical protein